VTFTLPDDLAPEVYPLAWLVGAWSGLGVIEYPDIPKTQFRSDVAFTHDGGPYLIYRCTWTVVGDDGEDGAIWSSEQGYWRVPPETPEDLELRENLYPVELLLADASGSISLMIGAVGNGKIELASDLMARSASAPDVGGASRLYGHVAGELMFAFDIAAFGNELRSYASGRMSRVEES
jgi:hypothetical protein